MGVWQQLFWSLFCMYTITDDVQGNAVAKNLFKKVMWESGYNKFIRPVRNESQQIIVHIGLTLAQIIDVDENKQILTTNVLVTKQWHDYRLIWDPQEYNNITHLYVPAESIWHPDIVLYNNADGQYELTADTQVSLSYNGTVKWKPPVSLKSSCNIDVTYFPFDKQTCDMQFGSWTYNIDEVEIRHVNESRSVDGQIAPGVDLHMFYTSVEWDIMSIPASKDTIHYAGSKQKFRKWTFTFVLKRKFLFYTINLIIPLVSHVFITILVFYLPADSKEKIALCINILLSLIVFFLMLAEIVPPSSVVTPLLGKYLVFTLMLVVCSVIITVITYNIHFRSSATHTMPDCIRKFFLYWLPKLLRMRRPKIENSHDVELKNIQLSFCSCFGKEDPYTQWMKERRNKEPHTRGGRGEMEKISAELEEDRLALRASQSSRDVQNVIESALYIVNYLKLEDEFNRTKEDWKYVALVLDRLFLCIYLMITVCGTVGIICQAPMLYDTTTPII